VSDWVYSLPFPVMAALVALITAVVTFTIHRVVLGLATGDRLRAFKGVSPGLLPPLSVIFALLVGFIAAQVWSDTDRARLAVNREASALRAVVLLADAFPADVRTQFRGVVARHVDDAVTNEWPAMAHKQVTLTMVPAALAEGLRLALELKPEGPGQMAAQREIISSLQTALDARRQRIIVSRSTLDWVRWSGLILQALITLVAIAFVHSDNRTSSALALGLFASAAAVALLLIASHVRPFAGTVAVGPDVLLQVMPEGEKGS
jgi:Protein of unknown function (DUF4239)